MTKLTSAQSVQRCRLAPSARLLVLARLEDRHFADLALAARRQRCVRRSRTAPVSRSPPRTSGHSSNGRFVVTSEHARAFVDRRRPPPFSLFGCITDSRQRDNWRNERKPFPPEEVDTALPPSFLDIGLKVLNRLCSLTRSDICGLVACRLQQFQGLQNCTVVRLGTYARQQALNQRRGLGAIIAVLYQLIDQF